MSRIGMIALTLLLSVSAQRIWSQDKLPPSSDPQNLFAFQDFIYCSADDGSHGRELWRVNLEGTKELVMDITPGSAGTEIYGFGAVGNILYFGVRNLESRGDFWRTDGTRAGTWRIKKFHVNEDQGFGSVIGELRGKVVLSVRVYSDPTLWISDGTEAGTIPFVDENSDAPYKNFFSTPSIISNFMYFSAALKESGFGVFRSDGTREGTVMLCKSVGLAGNFFSFDQKQVLFQCETIESGIEPWVTDGTPGNTHLFLDIYPGSAKGGIDELHRLGNERDPALAVFVSETADTGRELWATDGTVEGTRPLPEIVPGPGSAFPGHLIGGSEYTYFSARVPEFGVEVWRANPRTNVIERMTDINPESGNADPYAFCTLNGNSVLFSANSPAFGEELWSLGPDSKPVKVLVDLIGGEESSFPYYTTELNGLVVYAATDPNYGRELWVTDGFNRPKMLADIYSDVSINPSSSPRELTAVGDILYFVANDLVKGSEPWRSDGTPEGTYILKDLFPGRPSSDPRELTAADGFLYFTADFGADGERLWRSDGTDAGTVAIGQSLGSPQDLIAFNGALFCTAINTDGTNGRELWRVDHSGQASRLIDINSDKSSSEPHSLVVAGAFLYFLANDGVHGEELWRTDGSGEGTEMVRDIVDKPIEPVSAAEIAEVGSRLYFAGETASQGNELWSIDFEKSVAGPVKDIAQVDTLLLTKPTVEPGP